MSPTTPTSTSKSIRPTASSPMTATSPRLAFHRAVLAILLVLLVQPALVVSQTQAQQCVEIDFDSSANLCQGIGKLSLPNTPPQAAVAVVNPFLNSPSLNQSSSSTTARNLLNNPSLERYSRLLREFMFTVEGIQGWGITFAKCAPKALHGRWYRALTCSTLVQMSNTYCQSGPPRPLLCPKELKEAFATWKQAFGHPSNACPPDWAKQFNDIVSKSRLLRDSKESSCFPGSKVEGEALCGFPTLSQACANSCRTPAFVAEALKTASLGNVPIEQACKLLMSRQDRNIPPLNFDPVPFLTEASFEAPSGMATSPTGTGSEGTASGSPTTTDGAFPPAATDSTTLGFMDRPIAGIAGKFWVIGGVGIIGIAVILVGVVMIRRRTAASMAAKSRNMRFEESGSTPRDGFGEKPPALALGTLTSSRVPQQGPMSPTNEYGAYNNNGQSLHPQQQHYSNDRKDFFPPSPTQDHFRHPRSPSPPPPHAAHAQGGWQGPHQDAYGSMAPPPPPPAKEPSAGRPETWTKIAQRDSTRPPSMMPRDPVYPRPAILSYMPRLEDELEVHVGDQVAVWEDYADGYAWGETMDGRQGVFPIMCLADPNVPLEQQLPPPPPPQHMQQQGAPQMQQSPGGEPLRDMQEGGVRETMVNPQAYRFTQYTVASDMSDDDVADYRGHQQPPMPQQAYHQQQPSQQQQQYAQQPHQQYYGQQQGQGQQRW